MLKRFCMVMMMSLMLVACSSQQDEALPTRVVLPDENSIPETTQTIAQADDLPTETPARSGLPTLPPTFTPAPTETPIPTRTPTNTPVIQVGAILFAYNNDSIIRVNDDGTSQELIITFGVGIPISNMRLSPKGDLIAFIAPGNGSAREVWIANSTGTYLQQVSCLGYANLQNLTWSLDGQALAFTASQAPNDPMDIYTVGWQGANDCPIGNKQQLVLDRNSTNFGGLAFSADGSHLFFSDGQIYAVNLSNFSVSEALSPSIGFGADFNLANHPNANTLAYLQDIGRQTGGVRGGNLTFLNVATLDRMNVLSQDTIPIQKFVWKHDGSAVLQSLENRVVLVPVGSGVSRTATSTAARFPNAVFSPDELGVAYLGEDSTTPTLSQIFTVSLTGGTPRQITAITEGQIGDFVWVSK